MNPNKRQATQSGSIWGTARRDGPFFRLAALRLACVQQQAQGARHALQKQKNGRVAAAGISVGIS